jgi:WD40 repeat protein
LQILKGNLDWVKSVAFSPDGKLVVSGSWDETVRLWDTVTGAALQTLEGHSGSIRSVAFSPDGKQVYTLFVSNDWVAEGGTNILWLPPDYQTSCIAVWNGIVVLGHPSGRISFLKFKEGPKLI